MEYMRMREKQAMQQSDNVEMQDMVNHPPHYNKAGIETIDAIKAMTDTGFEYYLQGNIMKYLLRAGKKRGSAATEDMGKATWYISRLQRRLFTIEHENRKSKDR